MKHQPADHEEWESLTALAALDGLEPAEEERLMAHIATCAQCRATLTDLRAIAQRMDAAIPQVQAPSHLHDRLMEQVRAEQRQPARRPRRWLPAVAVVCVLLLAFLTFGRTWLGTDDPLQDLLADPQAATAALAPAAADPAASGRLAWRDETAALEVRGLAPTSEDRVYQVWYIALDQPPVSGETFTVAADGSATIALTAPGGLANYTLVAITEEPTGGSPAPTTPVLLAGEL